MLSIMDLVELEVLRMMSAPPASERLFPSRTISSAPSSRILIRGMRNRNGLEARSFCVLHCQVPKAADSKHRHALVRPRIGPAEPAVNRVPGTKDRCGLLVGNLIGNQVRNVGVHRHVLGVTALRIAPCALQIRAEHPATALAPFAASASRLNPGGTYAVADLSRGDVGGHSNDFADRLVSEDSRKLSGQVSLRLMYVGVADAAGVHLHQDLTGPGLRLGNIFNLPGTADSGHDRSFHENFS